MFQISPLFDLLPQPAFPGQMMQQTVQLYQDDAFFRLAHEKARRRSHLTGIFSGKRPAAVHISNNLRHLAPIDAGVEHQYLARGYFQESDPQQFAEKCARLRHCIVIVNNNDAHAGGDATGYKAFYNACPDTLFVVWDWDNHHWLELSSVLAAHSDLYVPTHQENLYLLSRYNANITEAVAAGVSQWTRDFLRERQDAMVASQRSDAPLGMHIPYAPFQYRNRVVATLQSRYPSIGFSSHQFHERSAEEKFGEWIAHKLHLIVPVLNDVPIRLFDALATGGIPLIPDSLRFTHWLNDAHVEDFLCYSADDILHPQAMVERGCEMFDRHGEAGIRRRAGYALQQHHGDARVGMILNAVARLYGSVWKH
ncbi:MAG: hypothetical protein HY849_07130 [Nitrosomonadales bacterium]|nr:hypothetical protein [Nitrosomonadales bacterium]